MDKFHQVKHHIRRLSSGRITQVRRHIRRTSQSTLETSFTTGMRNAINVQLGKQGELYIMNLLHERGFQVTRVGHITAGVGDLVAAYTLRTEYESRKWLIEVKTFFDREKQKDKGRIIFRRARPQINIKAHRSMERHAREINAKPIYAFLIVDNSFDGSIHQPIFRFSSKNAYFLSGKRINKLIEKSRSTANIKISRRDLKEKFDFNLKR